MFTPPHHRARLIGLFLPRPDAPPPAYGATAAFLTDAEGRRLHLFHEYFHGDDGTGLGASHQTGWTALAARCIEDMVRRRASAARSQGGGDTAGARANRASADEPEGAARWVP